MSRITITKPDDWHIHLRDGDMLERTVNDVAAWANRAVVMPNLTPPVKNVADATAYHSRIMTALKGFPKFEPLMTLYLTNSTTPDDIVAAAASPLVCGVKLYPAGATTNSAAGVTGLETLKPTLEAMQSHDLPLLIHGEVTDPDVDIFDREAKFIERTLAPLTDEFPELRVILEHIPPRIRSILSLSRDREWRQPSHRNTYCLIETTCSSAVLDRTFSAFLS